MNAFALIPNIRFFVPPINVSETIQSAFTTEEFVPINHTDLYVEIGTFRRMYLTVFLNSSYPATALNRRSKVIDYVPVYLLGCKLEFVSPFSDFELPCSQLPNYSFPCMLPVQKLAHLPFGIIYMSPCKIGRPFQIQFSATALECLDPMCLSRNHINVPLVALSPLIVATNSSVSELKCVSTMNSSITIIASSYQYQTIAFTVFGTNGNELNCLATHVYGRLRLEPVGDTLQFHTRNVAQVLSPVQENWLPWSELQVSVYSSCSFILPKWSVLKAGMYRFVLVLTSVNLIEMTDQFRVYPGPPSLIFLIGSINTILNGGDPIFSMNSTELQTAIYLTVVDGNNNTVVSPVAPHYFVSMNGTDSAGNIYKFAGNISLFACTLDVNGSCFIKGVKAGLKTSPTNPLFIHFFCDNAELKIGPLVIANNGIPAQTEFSAAPNVPAVVVAGQPLPLLLMLVKDAGGNTFQLADIKQLLSKNVTVGIRVIIRRNTAITQSRRMHFAAFDDFETPNSCPGGGSYVIPLEEGPNGVVCNIQKTTPCKVGTFVITYELGFLYGSENFVASGISNYETLIAVEPGSCSHFGIRIINSGTDLNSEYDARKNNQTDASKYEFFKITTYTPLLDIFEVYFLDSGFNEVQAALNISSSVILMAGEPAKVIRQGNLVSRSSFSDNLGRNVTTSLVAGLILNVPFDKSNEVLVNISGFSNSIKMAHHPLTLQATFLCAPGFFLNCSQYSSYDLNVPSISQDLDIDQKQSSCSQWQCVQCPDGHVTSDPDLHWCRPCIPGMFANVNRTDCHDCTGNTWSTTAFQQLSTIGNCIECPKYFFATADHKSCLGLNMMTPPPSSIVGNLPGVLPSVVFVDQSGLIVNASAKLYFQLLCCNPKLMSCFFEASCNAEKTEQSPPFLSNHLSSFIETHQGSSPAQYVFQSFGLTNKDGLVVGTGYIWNITFRNVSTPLVVDHGWIETFRIFPEFVVSFLGDVPVVHMVVGLSGTNISFDGGSIITVYGHWDADPKVPSNIFREQCSYTSFSNNLSQGIVKFTSMANSTTPPQQNARLCVAPEGQFSCFWFCSIHASDVFFIDTGLVSSASNLTIITSDGRISQTPYHLKFVCPPGYFMRTYGSTNNCLRCPQAQTGISSTLGLNEPETMCYCSVGHYGTYGENCIICPANEGVICSMINSRWPLIKPGTIPFNTKFYIISVVLENFSHPQVIISIMICYQAVLERTRAMQF
jgi:hypothetical protein